MMTKTMALLVPLALALAAAPALAGDMIQTEGGKPGEYKWIPTPPESGDKPAMADFSKSQVKVTDENYDKIYYKFETVPNKQSVDTAKVVKVWYENVPTPYREAGAAMGDGNFAEAVQKFDAIATNKSAFEDWVRMYALWDMGRIYQDGMGDNEGALKVWDRLQREFPKSIFLPDAVVYAGKALLRLGKIQDARNKFLELTRLPGLPEGRKMLGEYYVIFITQKQGEVGPNTAVINQALGQYRSLLAKVENDANLKEVATRARLGIGDCLIILGQYDEALAFFQKIADAATDKGVLAGAFNGLGECYLQQRKWKEALLSFLRTVVLYDEMPEQTAMALYKAGDAYAFLRSGDDWKERARGLYRECMQRFPGTEWARRSEDGLQKVR